MARRHASLIPLSREHYDALSLAFRLHHPSPPGPATVTTPPSTPASRAAETLEFFSAHLEAHFRAEEQVLFPVISACAARVDDQPTAEILRELIAEHRGLERLRDAIAAAAGEESALAPLLVDFADLLERHVRAEERRLFVRFEAIVPEADAAALAPRIEAILSARSCKPHEI
jgi:hemerythrin superfamily protein